MNHILLSNQRPLLTPDLLKALTWKRYGRPGNRPATIQSRSRPLYTSRLVLSGCMTCAANSVTCDPPVYWG